MKLQQVQDNQFTITVPYVLVKIKKWKKGQELEWTMNKGKLMLEEK